MSPRHGRAGDSAAGRQCSRREGGWLQFQEALKAGEGAFRAPLLMRKLNAGTWSVGPLHS